MVQGTIVSKQHRTKSRAQKAEERIAGRVLSDGGRPSSVGGRRKSQSATTGTNSSVSERVSVAMPNSTPPKITGHHSPANPPDRPSPRRLLGGLRPAAVHRPSSAVRRRTKQ